MPMMMDDSLDDLFGDEPLAGISVLPDLPSIPKGLTQSTDDARLGGCSQYVRLPVYLKICSESSSERLPGPIRVALPALIAMAIA